MAKQRTQSNWSVYAVLGVLNCCLVFMFIVVLYPRPQSVPIAMADSTLTYHAPKAPVVRLAKQGVPTRVVVPSVNIDLPVKTGSYQPKNKSWTLDDSAIFYADQTVPANSRNGTTLLYGHGTWPLFGRIVDIRKGATAQVHTDTGLTFIYKYQSSQQVDPSDISMLTNEGPPILVLQTCSGPFDAYRTLVSFKLVEVTGYE